MNPQSAGRTPNSANTYREMYIASLMLDISNMAKTLNANRGIVTTGESGAPPVDGRTLTEKYADIDKLKVMIRGQLKEITDGQNAQDIVYELTTSELEFLAGQMPFIISDLKPKFQLGVPAESFIPYLRKLMRKNIETKGVEYGLQEAGDGGPGGGGLPPPSANNLIPLEAFEQFMYDLDDILEIPEEGDLQSIDSRSYLSSASSQSTVSSGFASLPPLNIRPAILTMRNMIHRDMLRAIAVWYTSEDIEIIDNCPDPFIVSNYQETISDFADTLPTFQQMASYRDQLEDAIANSDQDEASRIIKVWSSIVSNIDVNAMEDAKEIVRQAREATLNLDAVAGDEVLFPDEEGNEALDEENEIQALEEYFAEIQASPETVAFYAGRDQQTEVPEELLGEEQAEASSIQDEGSVMTELAPLPADIIPVLSYTEFTRLSINVKREYLTVIGVSMEPASLRNQFFEEIEEGLGTVFEMDVLEAFDSVFRNDEDADGGTSSEMNTIYGAMLQSQVLELNPGTILLDNPAAIAELSDELFNEVSTENLEPMEPLITREEFAQRSAEKGGPSLAEVERTRETELAGYSPRYLTSGETTPVKGNGIRTAIRRYKTPIRGRGLMSQKLSSKVVPSNIDLSLGVKAEPSYVSFGKHLINKHRLLKDDVLMLRTMKGGAIASVPTQKISKGLSKVIKIIIGGGQADFESLNILTDGDKEVLFNISKTSRISHSVPNPNKSSQEKEDSRFELLKGQIASGQDNKDAVKEFKLLLIKMMNQKRIPKGQAIDILTEMMAMGL